MADTGKSTQVGKYGNSEYRLQCNQQFTVASFNFFPAFWLLDFRAILQEEAGNLWRKASSNKADYVKRLKTNTHQICKQILLKKSLKEANSESITRVMMICFASNKRPNSYEMLLSKAQKNTPIHRQELRLGLSKGFDLKNIGFRRRFRRGWRWWLRRSSKKRNTLPANPG
ncbi:hypothetical protein CEXT_632901 [Caerostris extrusa]|uniref:LAGLIDADG homing endonuclease n=1 Tax=Caerostris extrusa TaxID=172846 RepID=A0AAV4VUN9_CAEEX|nr:hypothetical protein CEXT_632901 [Caerostris extrusa]